MVVDLAQVMVSLPHGRTMSMADLIEGWRAHVGKMSREARVQPTRSTWGGHDFVAALTLRDFIADGIAPLDVQTASDVMTRLSVVDDDFRAFTEPDEGHAVRSFAERLRPDERWWWDRLPISGPVRAELLG